MKSKIVERKLGKERAAGIAHNVPRQKKFGTIELDPRIEKHGGKNINYLDTVIHEAIHMIDPEMHEDDVVEMSRKITGVVWAAGFRRVNL